MEKHEKLDEKEQTTEEIVKELTDEHIQAVLAEKERREAERKKADLEGFTKRKPIAGICPKCKTWYTEDDIRKYPVCPICGNKDVTPVD